MEHNEHTFNELVEREWPEKIFEGCQITTGHNTIGDQIIILQQGHAIEERLKRNCAERNPQVAVTLES